jgi:hypothetical protein
MLTNQVETFSGMCGVMSAPVWILSRAGNVYVSSAALVLYFVIIEREYRARGSQQR